MYRSVVFYKTESQKRKINNSVKLIENKFKREVVTFVKKLDTFYRAESYHQDFYEKNFIRYLIYKKNCQREQILDKIWQWIHIINPYHDFANKLGDSKKH